MKPVMQSMRQKKNHCQRFLHLLCLKKHSYIFLSNECAKECYCPRSYPFAMSCDHRELKVIPDVPSHIRHLYIQFNKVDAIAAKPFINATSLREINLSHNNLRKVWKRPSINFNASHSFTLSTTIWRKFHNLCPTLFRYSTWVSTKSQRYHPPLFET